MFESKISRVSWPMIVFFFLMVALLGGPVLHLMFFFFHLVFAALPFLIVLGVALMISRRWWGHGSYKMRRHWRHGWDNSEKPKRSDGDGIFYV